jgi:hypothetical protein
MALEIRKEDIRQESVNTTPDQFKVIDDVKDEPTLKEAQDFVGGIVEGIQFPNGDYMIINEEGKLINLPLKYIYTYNTRTGCAPPAGRASSVAPSALRASGRASIEVPHHFGNPNYSNTLI